MYPRREENKIAPFFLKVNHHVSNYYNPSYIIKSESEGFIPKKTFLEI